MVALGERGGCESDGREDFGAQPACSSERADMEAEWAEKIFHALRGERPREGFASQPEPCADDLCCYRSSNICRLPSVF